MRDQKEGKLLARAVRILSPWGSKRTGKPGVLCRRSFCGCKKIAALSAGPAIPLTPIRVREKRMNTYKTIKTGRSYQNINNKVCKNLIRTWNLFLPATYY